MFARTLTPVVLAAALIGCTATPQDGPAAPDWNDDNAARTQAVRGEVSSSIRAEAGSDATVEAWSLDDNGTVAVVGSGSLDADGQYAIDVSGHEGFVVMQVVSGGDAVLGAVIVEPDMDGDGDRAASPITAETTLETSIMLEGNTEHDLELGAWPMVRALVDAEVVSAVDGNTDSESHEALTTTITAAVMAEAEAWADAGHDVNTITTARVLASSDLSADEHSGVNGAFETYLDVLADIEAAEEDAAVWSEAHSRAALTLELAAEATEMSEDETDALLDAWLTLSAEAHAAAVTEASDAMDGSDEMAEAVLDANAELEAVLRSDADLSVKLDAIVEWRDTLTGADASSKPDDSLLADLLGEVTADLSLDAVLAAEADLRAQLQLAAETVQQSGDDSAEALTVAGADLWASHRSELEAGVSSALSSEADSSAAVDLVVTTRLAFGTL